MKKCWILFLLIVAACFDSFVSCKNATTESTSITRTKQAVAKDISSFQQHLRDTLLPQMQRGAGIDSLRRNFLQARLNYKRFEWAAEYFMTNTTRMVNGPPVPEVEVEENKVVEPEGLQVMGAMLYPTPDTIAYEELQHQVRLLTAYTNRYQQYWEQLSIDSSQVFDALRLELFRITALGISGFDAGLSQNSFAEAAASMESMSGVLKLFDENATVLSRFDDAIKFLRNAASFNNFDRLQFIKQYADPLSKAVTQLQQQLHIPFVADHRLLRSSTASLFQKDAFNPDAYTQDSSFWSTPAKVVLGRTLFYDPVLSQANSRSCATCHQPALAFTDGLQVSKGLSENIRRNAPTLLNAALQPSLFYDMRATNLENQSRMVIHNETEMHGNLGDALKKIVAKPAYASLLQQAFPKATVYTEQNLQNALATYVRSLTLMSSRFDVYMRNEADADLSADEKRGFNLFMGKAKCGTCHFMPLFNGTVPPAFLEMESEVIGAPSANKKQLDEDLGRYAINPLAPFKNAFKTTTVRNSAATAPYMHNGVHQTLAKVIDFYDGGGGAGLGFDVPNQTLPTDKLKLTSTEKAQLIAFLHTLTDRPQ